MLNYQYNICIILNFKILIIIGAIASIIIILLANYSFTKPETSQENSEVVTKGSIIANNTSLYENYTSLELLNYCSGNESLIYDDTCIRGLWDVADSCKNANFSSSNAICNDPKLDKFETKIDKEMQDLGKSLTQNIDSCMVAKSNDDIQSCLVTIERIKNDCTDPHFYSLTHICTDPRLDQFVQTHSDNSAR